MTNNATKSVIDINVFPLDTLYKSPKKLKKYINKNFLSNSNKKDNKTNINTQTPISTRIQHQDQQIKK